MTRDALESLAAHARPMSGGFSGETFLVGAAGEQAVLRLYVRNPDRAVVDAGLLDLVRGLVPVPRVLDLRTPEMADGHAYLLTELMPGELMEAVLPTADDSLRRRLARSVAEVLARLNGIPFRTAGGLVGPGLKVRAWPPFEEGLTGWARRHLAAPPLAGWDPSEHEGLLRVADHADELLADTGRWCLVHGDFNAKNLLVDPVTAEVTAVLDWEFAHAGTPYTDLGNLLRLERDPAFVEPLLERFSERAPSMPDDLLDRARAADLWALVELASRAVRHPPAERAYALLKAIAATGDLHAPPATPP